MTCSDFIFRLPGGEEVGRAADLVEFEKAIKNVPVESIEYHHKNRHFSQWLINHNHKTLAKNIEKEKKAGEVLRKSLIRAVQKERK